MPVVAVAKHAPFALVILPQPQLGCRCSCAEAGLWAVVASILSCVEHASGSFGRSNCDCVVAKARRWCCGVVNVCQGVLLYDAATDKYSVEWPQEEMEELVSSFAEADRGMELSDLVRDVFRNNEARWLTRLATPDVDCRRIPPPCVVMGTTGGVEWSVVHCR